MPINIKEYARSDSPKSVSDVKNNTAPTTESKAASFSIFNELVRWRGDIDHGPKELERDVRYGSLPTVEYTTSERLVAAA